MMKIKDVPWNYQNCLNGEDHLYWFYCDYG